MARRALGSVSKRGNRYYVRLTRPDGRRTTRGSWGSRREAEAAIPDLVDDLGGEDRAEAGLLDFYEETYRRLVATRQCKKLQRQTATVVKRCAAWLGRRYGSPAMHDVGGVEAEDYLAHLVENLSPSTVVAYITILSRAWKAAIDRGLADENPWSGLSAPKAQPKEIPWLSPADLRRVVAATRPRSRALVQIMAETGLRIGEALALDWRDVDGSTLTVRRSVWGPTKSRRVRQVPLLETTVSLLNRLREGRAAVPMRGPDPIFPDAPAQFHVRSDLRRACKVVGLPTVTPHGLRHLYASHLVQAGVPFPQIAKLLGHSDSGRLVSRLYGRWMPDDAARVAVNALERFRAPVSVAKTPGGRNKIEAG